MRIHTLFKIFIQSSTKNARDLGVRRLMREFFTDTSHVSRPGTDKLFWPRDNNGRRIIIVNATSPSLHGVRPAHQLKSMMFSFLNTMKSNISASTSTERQYNTPCNPCLKKIPFLHRNRVHILKEIKEQEGKNLPCDSRSARRMFKFQSCYGVGCPGANIQCLTTSLRKQRHVIFLS
jgi:hypothetical protein